MDEYSLLVPSFLSAIQTFSTGCSGSGIKSIECNRIKFFFYNDDVHDLCYIFSTKIKCSSKKVNSKIQKIVSLFYQEYSSYLKNFTGEVTMFNQFPDALIKLKMV